MELAQIIISYADLRFSFVRNFLMARFMFSKFNVSFLTNDLFY